MCGKEIVSGFGNEILVCFLSGLLPLFHMRGHPKVATQNITLKMVNVYTVNPNPVQLTAFPCKSIPTGKNLLSLQGNPVLIEGSLFSLQGFPCISLYFPVRVTSMYWYDFRRSL